MSPLDPQALPSRLTALLLFALSLLFLIAGLGVYRTSPLRNMLPTDDMGGPTVFPELMLLGFLFLSPLTSLLFIFKGTKAARPLHLGWSIGIDCFVCLTLLAVSSASLALSRFSAADARCANKFFCAPAWGTVRGLVVTAYAFALVLSLHHGVLFCVAARKLDVLRKAERSERLGAGRDGDGAGLGDMPERKV